MPISWRATVHNLHRWQRGEGQIPIWSAWPGPVWYDLLWNETLMCPSLGQLGHPRNELMSCHALLPSIPRLFLSYWDKHDDKPRPKRTAMIERLSFLPRKELPQAALQWHSAFHKPKPVSGTKAAGSTRLCHRFKKTWFAPLAFALLSKGNQATFELMHGSIGICPIKSARLIKTSCTKTQERSLLN